MKKIVFFMIFISLSLILCTNVLFATEDSDLSINSEIQKDSISTNDYQIKDVSKTEPQDNNYKIESKEDISKDDNNYEKKATKNLVKNNNKTLKEYSDDYIVTVNSKTDYEGYVDITASVKDTYGNPANSGSVSFHSEGRTLGSDYVYNGIASINKKLTAGTYYITAKYKYFYQGTGIYTIKKGSYSGDYDYTDYTPYTSKSYDITFPYKTVYIGEDCTISISISYGGEKVEGGTVEFELLGDYMGTAEVKNGEASIKCKFYKEGCNLMSARYTPSIYNTYGGSKIVYAFLNVTSKSNDYYSNYYDDNYYDDNYYDDNYYDDNYYYNTKTPTKITVNSAKTVYIGNTITINGKLTANGKTLPYEYVSITVNGIKYTRTTSSDGLYTLKLTPTSPGTINIKASYSGSNSYDSCTATKSLTIKRKNDITITHPKSVTLGNKFQIKGKLTQTGKGIPSAKIDITYNGKIYKTTTNKNGEYKLKLPTTKIGSKTITVQYNGKFKAKTSSKITINKKTSKLTATTNTNMIVGQKVTIKGRLTVNGKGAGYQKIIINLDGKQYTKTTNKYGYYAYSIKTTKIGTKKVTITYKGNTKNAKTSTKKTFTVKDKPKAKITINNIPTVQKGNTIKISGKITDNKGKIMKNTNLIVTINGKKYTTKTNSNGKFTYKYKTTTIGQNKITITFNGNTKNSKTSNSKTFKVTKAYYSSTAKNKKPYIENPYDYGPQYICSTIKLNGNYYHRGCGGLLEHNGYTKSARDSTKITQSLKCHKCGHVFADYKYDYTQFL